MNIKQLRPLFDLVDEEADVNPLRAAEHQYFKEPYVPPQLQTDKRTFRDKALDRVLELKLPFASTMNGYCEIFNRFVKVTCPYCGEPMEQKDGGANCAIAYVKYHCTKCKASVGITMPIDGFWAEPDRNWHLTPTKGANE
jgi:hypothetical protein